MSAPLSPFTQLSCTVHGAIDVVGPEYSGSLDVFAVVEHARYPSKDDACAAPTTWGVTSVRSGTRAPTGAGRCWPARCISSCACGPSSPVCVLRGRDA